MPQLEFKCPHCNKTTATYAEVGKMAVCRHCSKRIEVPVNASPASPMGSAPLNLNRSYRAKPSNPRFYIQLVIIGLSTYCVSTLGIYLFARITGFDVKEPDKIYQGLAYFLLIAGAVSANACGRYTRSIFGKSITPLVIGGIAATWIIGLIVWFVYFMIGTNHFPDVAKDATGIFLFATLCMVGWMPIGEN